MTRNLRLIVVFTCAHVVVTLACVVYFMAAGSARFDNPELPQTLVERAAEGAANVLTLPARFLWTSWASRNLPNFLEWLLFAANSALWGGSAVAVMNGLFASRDRRTASRGGARGWTRGR
jgi:hypothetical protein